MNKEKVIGVIAIIALILAAVAAYRSFTSTQYQNGLVGSAGGLLAENYIPYVQYNGGYNTAKSIATTGDLTVGSSGSALGIIKTGTCALSSPVATYAATSTYTLTCVDTAVLAGDDIQATMNNPILSSAGVYGSFAAVNAVATTSGYFGVSLLNITGAATSSVNAAYLQANYLVTR